MTMTPTELPQMYVLMDAGMPQAVGVSIDALKARGTDKWNRLFGSDSQELITVDNWIDTDHEKIVSWVKSLSIQKVARA